MNVSATELANRSKAIVDKVLLGGQIVRLQRHGRTVAEIRRKVGVTREELVERLSEIKFSHTEQNQLTRAMNAAAEMFGHAGRD